MAASPAGASILETTVFFAVWRAWISLTWFASAYDTHDVLHRIVTLAQISGVLVLAAGIAEVFEDHDFVAVWPGYAITRFALTSQWLRVA